MKKLSLVLASLAILGPSVGLAGTQAAKQATIQPDTKAQIVLQSHLSSKLSEPGDNITAVLYEPIYADGHLVMQRGTEFHGHVVSVTPAKRGEKNAQMIILFDKVAMPWGEEPVSLLITAVDDWRTNTKLKTNSEGKVDPGHNGDKTVDNVERGGVIGAVAAGGVVLGGGPGAAGAGLVGAGLLGGLMMSKGGEVKLDPGVSFRVKFVKPLTLPIMSEPAKAPAPILQDSQSGS
ncbi:MAG TPA: hypothetical protein VI756_16165 [Blastocatellia bacterium]